MKQFILSCDLETTGLSPSNDDWITGSFGLLDFQTLEPIRSLELTSRPNRWSVEAAAHHKIKREDAMNFLPRKEALLKLIDFLPPRGSFVFLCHANTISKESTREYREGHVYNSPMFIHFDFACLKMDFFDTLSIFEFRKYFNDADVYSTWTMANELISMGALPKDLEPTLDGLCAYFKIVFNHHNALSDRLATEELYAKMRSLYGTVGERDSKLNSRTSALSRTIGSQDQQRFGL